MCAEIDWGNYGKFFFGQKRPVHRWYEAHCHAGSMVLATTLQDDVGATVDAQLSRTFDPVMAIRLSRWFLFCTVVGVPAARPIFASNAQT
jgi:hypothetical protein